MEIEVIELSDSAFDEALERFALIDGVLSLRAEVNRPLEPEEVLDRYAFTALVEALWSEEFEEDPFETVRDLELEESFESAEAAWEAVKHFYATRGCVLLCVGDDLSEEFIVGSELAERFGFTNDLS